MRLFEITESADSINETLLESFHQSEQTEQWQTATLDQLMEAVDGITKS